MERAPRSWAQISNWVMPHLAYEIQQLLLDEERSIELTSRFDNSNFGLSIVINKVSWQFASCSL